MPFPPTPRVIYKKNPLKEVICQLRFPPILRIDKPPIDFQDLVSEQFPDLTTSYDLIVTSPPVQVGKISVDVSGPVPAQPSIANYEFASEDKTWRTNLTRDFISLTTVSYERWEVFRERLRIPLEALIAIYKPHRSTRVGLRYVDVIQRSVLDMHDEPWSELLKPHLLGMVGDPDLTDSVKSFRSTYELGLGDEGDRVRITTTSTDMDTEKCFVIDSDFFANRPISLEAVMTT